MFMSKSFCHLVFSVMLLMIVLLPCSVFAEVKDITAIGEYNMGESETLIVAKERAVYNAMQNAIERAGVYIESYTRTINSSVSKDEINMIASGIIEITDKKIDRKMNDTGGDFIKATITCKINTDNIQSIMNKLQDKSTVDDLKKVQSDYKKAMQEITALKQQLTQSKTTLEKQQVEVKIVQSEQFFTATQWFEKGYNYQKNKENDNAIFAYNKAISLNSQYDLAYNNRGNAYKEKGQINLAIADYDKAIALNPQLTLAYKNRGTAYAFQGQLDIAIVDFNQAITLNPQYDGAYNNRGFIYYNKGQYDLAIADYNKAIALNPHEALTVSA